MDATSSEIHDVLSAYSAHVKANDVDVCGTGDSTQIMPQNELENAVKNIPASNELDTYLMNFFKTCDSDFDMIEEKSVLLSALDDHRVYFKSLGFDIYLLVCVYQMNVTIQIRKFVTNASGELLATRDGITFGLKTWFSFLNKIFSFSLRYESSSFVCANNVLILSAGDTMIIRNIRSSRFIILNDCHLTILKEVLPEMTDKLLAFLYENYLAGLIAQQCTPDPINKENFMMEEVRLCAHLERHLSSAMYDAFFCLGCSINSSGQRSHDCIMKSEMEKYQHVGRTIFLLINFAAVAKDFVNDNSNISLEFLLNMDFNRISDVMYKTL